MFALEEEKTVDIFHLASPVQLGLQDTTIFLEDYFIEVSRIASVEVSAGLSASLSEDKKTLIVSVVDQNFPPIAELLVKMVDDSQHTLVLKKSKKIRHRINYNAWGAWLHNVQVAGSFNSWNPSNHHLHYENGLWVIDLYLEPGNYEYQLIADGNWFTDPDNPVRADNGYGGINSILKVESPYKDFEAHIQTERAFEIALIIKADKDVTDFVVLWQNQKLDSTSLFRNDNKLMITVPFEAFEMQRSFIRVWAYNEAGYSNDLLIPLEHGRVFYDTAKLTLNDKEAQIMYFILVDRFFNGNPSNDQPIIDQDLHAKVNFHGGDIAGIIHKIKDGYLTKLGVNSLWISPLSQNPEFAIEKDGRKWSGYHGYWPTISTKIDSRFGSVYELFDLVDNAHKNNIAILLDYVSHHVHKDNIVFSCNPEWSTPLILPDGSKNIGRWEEHRLTTWFDEFLPTLNYFNPEVVDTMTEMALFWIFNYNLDGFRHDATKHVPEVFWRGLTNKLKKNIMITQNKRIYQIGETFGGRDLLASYINSGMLDGQFSFNLYYEVRNCFLREEDSFEKLATAVEQDLQMFGHHHMMGNITGNHDLPRFMSYAGEDLATWQNAEHEGWVRHIGVKNPIGYKKMQALTAFICTIPGIPVIFYGDEIGMPGGSDPDNRRPMKFQGLTPDEQATLDSARKVIWLRRGLMSLNYGDYQVVTLEPQVYVYRRTFFEETSFVCFNKTQTDHTITIPLPENLHKKQFYNSFGGVLQVKEKELTITLKPWTFEVISNKKVTIG